MEVQKLSKPNQAIRHLYERGYRSKSDGTILKADGTVQPLSYHSNGYKQFGYKYKGTLVCLQAHRFVAYQWYGDAMFEDELMVLHKNDRKGDNRIKNLKLGTRIENAKDAKRNGIKLGRKNLDKDEIYNYQLIHGTAKAVRHFNVSQATVDRIVKIKKNEQPKTSYQISIPF